MPFARFVGHVDAEPFFERGMDQTALRRPDVRALLGEVEPQRTQRGEAATVRSAPVPGRSNVGSLAVWEHSRASSHASLAAAGTAALREISSQLANNFDCCSAARRSRNRLRSPFGLADAQLRTDWPCAR